MKLMNYGFNVDFLSNKYGDFFIWRSPGEAYRPAFWEKAHPGWQCKSIRVEYNEYQRGYYVRLEFWRERNSP